MKFDKLLKQLKLNEETHTLERYEIFSKGNELLIKGSGSEYVISLEKWVSQDNDKEKLLILQKLCSKLLNKQITPNWDSIKRILNTVYKELNKIPDFYIKRDEKNNAIDIEPYDKEEYNITLQDAKFRQQLKGIV